MYKVLIVDDEPLILRGLRAIVDWKSLGLEIAAEACSGEEAIERFLESEIDLLITDIKMPGISGLELIKTVRSINPGVKCVVLSGYEDFQYVKEGIKLGIENYLLKPINDEELLATLSAAVVKLDSHVQLEHRIQREQQILRDNILIRWITNTIPIRELRDRSELVGIPLGLSSYTVALCRITPVDFNKEPVREEVRMEFISEALERTLSYAEKNASPLRDGLIFINLNGDMVIIYWGNGVDDPSRNDLQSIFGPLLEYLGECLHAIISLSIGSTVKSYACVHESYAHAKELQNNRFINQERSMINGEAPSRSTLGINGVYEPNEFVELWAKRDKEALVDWLNGVFLRLKKDESVLSSDANHTAIEMIIQIGKACGDSKLSTYFYDLSRCTTVEQIRQYIMKYMLRALSTVCESEANLSPLINKVIQEIHLHYAGELSLKTLSQQLQVHPVYLGQLFKKELNVGFTEYVNKYRIELAKEMLSSTDMRASEVAMKVGYPDPNYFYKQFTKFTGSTPSEFRLVRTPQNR